MSDHTIVYSFTELRSEEDAHKVQAALSNMRDVKDITISAADAGMTVTFNGDKKQSRQVERKLRELGYTVNPWDTFQKLD